MKVYIFYNDPEMILKKKINPQIVALIQSILLLVNSFKVTSSRFDYDAKALDA